MYHEQGFFEDGSGENIGFFGPNDDTGDPGGVRTQDNCDAEHPDDYSISPFQYDDDVMRQAANNVAQTGRFTGENYSLLGGNNCQDYGSALRREYRNLGGQVRYRPFGRRGAF